MRYIKKVLLVAVCFAFSIFIKDTAFAGAWERDISGWKYQKDNGDYARDNWKEIDEKWYYFDADGYMKTGWISSGDNWYYCGLNGSLVVNRWIGDYYVGENGSMLVNTTTPDGYEVGEDGLCINSGLSSAEISAFYQQKLDGWKKEFNNYEYYYDAQYLIRDIDQDGIDDLLLFHSGYRDLIGEEFNRAELYTIRDGKFVLSDSIYSNNYDTEYGFEAREKGKDILVRKKYPRPYAEYLYSITPKLEFMQEICYLLPENSSESGEIFENANHLYSGYENASELSNALGTKIEMVKLNGV